VTNAKIGNVIQSTNYSPGSSGWSINKDGSAEFNGVVISRQLEVDSGQKLFGSFSTSKTSSFQLLTARDVETTAVPISAWAGATKTYLAVAGVSDENPDSTIFTSSGTEPDVYWGFRVVVLPMTRWTSPQTLRLRIEFWGKNVTSVQNLAANWKIYEVV
jgi:hypothetical protein